MENNLMKFLEEESSLCFEQMNALKMEEQDHSVEELAVSMFNAGAFFAFEKVKSKLSELKQ